MTSLPARPESSPGLSHYLTGLASPSRPILYWAYPAGPSFTGPDAPSAPHGLCRRHKPIPLGHHQHLLPKCLP